MEKKFRYRNQTEQLLGELGGAGRSIAAALWEQKGKDRIESLDNTVLANGSVVEVIGIPRYLENVTSYEAYGLTEPGWYCFARITSRDGSKVDANTTITGDAGHILVEGAEYIDVAVRFDVAALKQRIVIDWGTYEDEIIFSASDLAIRNLDYRTTFYVYDIAPYATWEYAFTADTTFVADKKYFVKNGDAYEAAEVQTVAYVLTSDATFQVGKTYYISDGQGGYTQAQVQTVAYELTADETFQDGKTYYISDGAGGYTAATVTAGEAVTADTYYEQTTVPVPANTYYEQTTVPVPAYYVQTHPYALTTDATFTEGKTYYTKGEDDTYTAAEVTVGEAVTPDTYYVQTTAYVQVEGVFETGVTYYTKSGTEYTEAVVTTGDPIPAYYNHSKVTFAGMVRNVTYRLNTEIDCPVEFVLPAIEDDGYGAWYELQIKCLGSYSITLTMQDPEAKLASNTFGTLSGANIYTLDLIYTHVDDTKIWRVLRTNSTLPST